MRNALRLISGLRSKEYKMRMHPYSGRTRRESVTAAMGVKTAISSEELTHKTLLQANMFIPLCAKPATLKMIRDRDRAHLVEKAIRQCLTRGGGSNGKLIVFIADGDVMAKAVIAMDSRPTRAYRQVAEISAEIAAYVDQIIKKLQAESEEFKERIIGWIKWSDVAAGPKFQIILQELRQIMQSSKDEATLSHNEDLGIAIQAIQIAVRTLVKNLYTQRASKGKFTNIFTNDGLDILEGEKWKARYNELQEACLLELAAILGGLEHQGNTFWSEDEVQKDKTIECSE